MADIIVEGGTGVVNGTLQFGTLMASSPVIVKCNSGTFPTGSSMRRLILKVMRYSVVNGKAMFSDAEHIAWPVENGTDYSIDISSALRSLLGQYEFDPNVSLQDNYELDILRYALAIGKEYVYDGRLCNDFDINQHHTLTGGMYAVRGRLTDMEMYRLGNNGITNNAQSLRLSRKPKGEIVHKGSKWCQTVIPAFYNGTSPDYADLEQKPPKLSLYTVGSAKFNNETAGLGIYVEDSINYAEFVFINSLGAPEICTAYCLDKKTIEISSKIYSRVVTPSRRPYTGVSSVSVLSSEPTPKYSMSSGAVNKAWQEWWVTEFLAAKQWWMHVDNVWVPVKVSPGKKEQTIYDKTKAEALSVDFNVSMVLTDTDACKLF